MTLGHAPGAERQEHGEHDRDLLGQHRHGGADGDEEAFQPVVPGESEHEDHERGGDYAADGDDPNEAGEFALQRRARRFDVAQRVPDATQRRVRARVRGRSRCRGL